MMGSLPRAVISSMSPYALFWKSATEYRVSRSITSIRWCLTPCISPRVSFPVPISRPRYTCRESADMISPPNRRATATPSALLPDAFVPTMATALALLASKLTAGVYRQRLFPQFGYRPTSLLHRGGTAVPAGLPNHTRIHVGGECRRRPCSAAWMRARRYRTVTSRYRADGVNTE